MSQRSSSVSDLKAMFENSSNKQKSKPKQKVKRKRHSQSEKWENIFQIEQPELTQGPKKQYEHWDAVNDQQKVNTSIKTTPGKLQHDWGKHKDVEPTLINGPKKKIININYQTKQQETIRPTIITNKLVISDHISQKLNACLTKHIQEQNDVAEEKTNNEMMTCSPELVKPPELPQEPLKNARAYFSDQFIGPKLAIPYDTTGTWSGYSDYVGQGSYPRNREAFPNASRGTFDAIAIDANTRVILYEKENFQGKVLLDATGPMLINNVIWANSAAYLMTDAFQDSEIERNYPPSTRCWSETNMQLWTTGSVKIVAANSNLS